MEIAKKAIIRDAENGHESSVATLAIMGNDLGIDRSVTEDFKIAFEIFSRGSEKNMFREIFIKNLKSSENDFLSHQENEHVSKILNAMRNFK